MATYEYTMIEGRLDKYEKFVADLNAWGALGWELVSVSPNPHGLGAEKVRVAFLKRSSDNRPR